MQLLTYCVEIGREVLCLTCTFKMYIFVFLHTIVIIFFRTFVGSNQSKINIWYISQNISLLVIRLGYSQRNIFLINLAFGLVISKKIWHFDIKNYYRSKSTKFLYNIIIEKWCKKHFVNQINTKTNPNSLFYISHL